MDLIIKLMEEMTLNKFELRSSTWVDVTHINNPHSFYVRPCSYKSYIPKIQVRGEKLKQKDLQLNMKIIYISKRLKCFCRGSISRIDTSNNKCVIFAIDYGFLEEANLLNEMYFLLHGHDLPPLATHCQLANCLPLEELWTDRPTNAMKSYVGKERALLTVTEKTCDKLTVELTNTCPEDIASLLATTGYTKSDTNHHHTIRGLQLLKEESPSYMCSLLNLGDVIHVRTQYATSLNNFFVAEVDEYNDYLICFGAFSRDSKKRSDLRPQEMDVGTSVSVYVPTLMRYERGIIHKVTVPEQKAMVRLVDWGCVIDANILAMKPMSRKQFSRPIMAIYCALVQDQQRDYCVYQPYLIPGKEYLLTIKKVGHQFDKPNIVSLWPLPQKT